MSSASGRSLEERVLVLAPTGRDAALTRDVLCGAGVDVEVCANMVQVCNGLVAGAGVLLIAEEALTAAGLDQLSRALASQPPWSDVPVIVSTLADGGNEARIRAIRALEHGANVTLLERPVRILALHATVQAALRFRRRQYQMRDLHQQLREQMERLQSERELRARFVSMLAHDLRGPVSAAMFGLELLVHTPDFLDRREELGGRVQRNLVRIEQMVRNLLDASRFQAGHPLPLHLATADLGAIAAEVADELNGLSGSRVVLEVRAPVRGTWSAAELRRALWNLVSNGLKYGSPQGPVTVEVTAADGRARIRVHNVGNPITREDQARIFEPFSRAPDAEQGTQLGWGLGLTLVRGCVEAHGGRVLVESSAEAGTTFTLELPLDARPYQPDGLGPGARASPVRSP